jgi:inhibitor of cysteine peptidase
MVAKVYTKSMLRARAARPREARLPRGPALALAGLLALACAGTRQIEADRPYQAGIARVERILVRSSRKPPISVHVEAEGVLPDGCTEIHRVRQERSLSGVTVTLTTRRESSAVCAAEARSFRRSLRLDVSGLAPGLYFVEVNGIRDTFQIHEDLGAPDRFDRPLP